MDMRPCLCFMGPVRVARGLPGICMFCSVKTLLQNGQPSGTTVLGRRAKITVLGHLLSAELIIAIHLHSCCR